MQKNGNSAGLQFAQAESEEGVEFYDPIENARYVFVASESVSPTTVSASDVLYAPVDTTVNVDTDQLRIPEQIDIIVRDDDGTHLQTVEDAEDTEIPQLGSCVLELTSTPIKFYVAGAGPVSIERVDGGTALEFLDPSITLGARSVHKQPGRTLTTTEEPTDLMRTVSELSAALKGTSPERTYPTLRGHPPAIEHGESLEIPGGSRQPETGITIEVPPEYGHIFTVSSLAYFLGADVQPGESSRLITESGFTYSLIPDGEESFTETIADVLQHCFLLDCITRTEGIFPVQLAAREYAEEVLDVDLDFEQLYDQTVAERVEAYLSVGTDQLKPVRPEWRLTVDMPADPSYADCLPYLVNELAIIRCYEPGEKPVTDSDSILQENLDEETASEEMGSFTRRGPTLATNEVNQTGFVRSESTGSQREDAARMASSSVPQDEFFSIRDADSIFHSYLGEGIPVGANKASPQALKRQRSLNDAGGSETGVIIVCNDSEMNEETVVEDIYTGTDLLRIDGEVRENLHVEELRDVFEEECNLIHYIGHVDTRGLQCTDGYLDTGTLETVGATTFILNGCRSFKQGRKLIEKGALGGLVTLENVGNSLATDVGHNIAKLLNAGWPLDGALSVVQDDALVGRDYTVLGDVTTQITAADAGAQTMYIVQESGEEQYEVEPYTFPTRSRNLGSLYRPEFESEGLSYLLGGKTGTYGVSQDSLRDTFENFTAPVTTQSERQSTVVSLHWSDELIHNLNSLNTGVED